MRETTRPGTADAGRPRAGLPALAVGTLAVVTLALAGCSPSSPTAAAIEVTGDVAVHDPALVVGAEGEPWYVYSTDDIGLGFGAPQIRRSTDEGVTWERVGTAWDSATRPDWAYAAVPGVTNFWAPEIVERDGVYYL